MTQDTPDQLDRSLIALRRILRATELFARDLAQSAGVTPAQLRVLQIIAEQGGSYTPKELALRMGVSQATVTALVDRLVARAMVSRVRSDTDRRQTNVVISDLGQDAIREAPDALQQRYVRNFNALKDWEQTQVLSTLERVAAMLDADDLDASPVLTTGDIQASGKAD
ncbi:MAG: MarR family transcriptional regulator [Rhodobacteraceae bacterium]|jgi:DNA-binding MarR family transcriptional regulator|nr:MarR family transcriptional regulator [Paracoccaceae bacterium]